MFAAVQINMSLVFPQKSAKKRTQNKGLMVNCSTQEDQRPQSCVCRVQSWFLGQQGIYCQQIEGVVYPPQLWQARSHLPDMKAPAHVDTCRRSSPTCTWFDDGQEANEVHEAPARCDQTFWLLSQHALLHCELSAASLRAKRSRWQPQIHMVIMFIKLHF